MSLCLTPPHHHPCPFGFQTSHPPSISLSLHLPISHPLHFTGGALERGGRWRARWRDERKRGMCGRMEQCYLLLSLPSLHPLQAHYNGQNKACKKKEVVGGENRGRGRVLFFLHAFNNRGMISAYPLISSLLFPSPPSFLLFLALCNPSIWWEKG